MRTAVLTASISRAGGGVAEISRRIAQSLTEHSDVAVEVIALEDSFTKDDLALWQPLCPKTFTVRGPRSYGYAPDLAAALARSEADVAHVHGIWMYPSLAARRWSYRTDKPYLVTIHGMLEPWALRNSLWKKRVARWLVENEVLHQAACLHVNTHGEARNVRDAGFTNPICVIPNGVDIPNDLQSESPLRTDRSRRLKTLLYLGRLHPKKGLPNLLQAVAQLKERNALRDWQVVIAGWDQCGHERELKQLATSLGIYETVLFAGPQFGESRHFAYSSADAFILPSYSEGLPMVVLEAWAHSLPVLMTAECNLSEGFQTESAVRIAPEPNSIAESLAAFASMPDSERLKMGLRGRRLVEDCFTWAGVTKQLTQVYQWMMGDADTPEFVFINN